MGEEFNQREPENTKRTHQNPPIRGIFLRHQWMGFLEKLKGCDDEVNHVFSIALNSQGQDSATIFVRGLTIHVNLDLIKKVTIKPLGVGWGKQDRTINVTAGTKFFLPEEEPVEEKNEVRNDNLPYLWDEVFYKILKYIYCEGRLRIVYAYQFRLLYEIKLQTNLPIPSKLNVPHFLFQSIIEMNQRVREWNKRHISRDGLINLIVMNFLIHLSSLVLSVDFLDMDREAFIETQALILTQQEETPKYSVGRRKEREKEEEQKEG